VTSQLDKRNLSSDLSSSTCAQNTSAGPWVRLVSQREEPPKNRDIALWPNMRVVKNKCYVSQKQNGFNDKIHCDQIHWCSILLTFITKFTARL